ncbi:uncharacterized protein [Cebidichthys violaceus]|uniref:uncharacterized protein isoform X1 n=1 Tax=Cebidichthys violaceus TaxID=271503 RepID=UPI0035CB5B7B
MTSWTFMTHIFVFVLLNAIDPSKEKCYDYLDMHSWANLTKETFVLVTTKEPKGLNWTARCTLEAECLRKANGIGCQLIEHCLFTPLPQKTSPECEGNSSQVHIYHFMCLMAKRFEHSLEGCEYNTVCKIYSETASTTSDLTTTPTTTTPTTTTPTTTTTPSTTTPTTTTPSTTTPSTTTPTTTTPSTTTPSTTTTATIATLKPTATKLAPGSSVPQVEDENVRLLKNTQEKTEELKTWLWLSLVLHVIVPLALFLYMRHRWRRDRMSWDSTHVSNGNLTGDLPMKEPDAPPASLDKDAENTHLMKRDICVIGEDQTQL